MQISEYQSLLRKRHSSDKKSTLLDRPRVVALNPLAYLEGEEMLKSRLCVVSLAPLFVLAGWTPTIVAQQQPLPATGAPRFDARIGNVPKPPAPPASPSVDAMLTAAHLTSAQVERRKATTPASAAMRAEVAEPPAAPERRERSGGFRAKPAGVPPSPNTRELIEILRQRPGGAQLLERARRGGAQITPPISSIGSDKFSDGEGPGPSVSLLHERAYPPFAALAPVTIKVSRNGQSASLPGLGALSANAYYPLYATSDLNIWGPLDRYTYSAVTSPVGGTYAAKSFVNIAVRVDSVGWYLINVLASGNPHAEMRKYTSATAGYTIIQSFPAPTGAGYHSYPVLVNLAAGGHHFVWVNLDSWTYVSEVSLTKL